MPGGESAQIGLVKNINIFDPYRRWNLFALVPSQIVG